MESKEYFEKVMQSYNQNGKGRSLRKYCNDEAIDYDWGIKYKKTYPPTAPKDSDASRDSFIPVIIKKAAPASKTWQVSTLVLTSPEGDRVEISSTNISAVADILYKMSRP